MKYLAALLVAGLAVVAVLVPDPEDPATDQAAGAEEPPVAICPVQEGSGRSTDVAILSTVDGPTQLTLFTGGGTAGSLGTRTGPSGSTVIPVGDVAAVGTVGGLIELPVAESTAGTVISGAESFMAEPCASVPATQTFLAGGSTISGETFEIQLMNPYAGEAIATLEVVSEAGLESNERFDSVIVPSRSSTLIDFNQLMPGRESISVSIETTLGSVIAVGRQGIEGERALWRAVEPAQDWFLPVPSGPGRELVVATPSTAEVDFQVDVYGPEGLEEAFLFDTLDARGRFELDVAQIGEGASAVRVIATGPVVASLHVDAEETLAVTTAAPVQANRWMLPGAGAPEGGFSNVVIMNASLDDSTVSIRPLREETSIRRFVVEADDVVEIGLQAADGYLIEGTSPIVVLWTATTATGGAASIGLPLDDG